MERIIRDEMMIHLVENNLIADQKHEFVNNKSCITNILETMDLMTQADTQSKYFYLIENKEL